MIAAPAPPAPRFPAVRAVPPPGAGPAAGPGPCRRPRGRPRRPGAAVAVEVARALLALGGAAAWAAVLVLAAG